MRIPGMLMRIFLLAASFLAGISPAGAEPAAAGREVPSLTEVAFTRTIRDADCIVLYANELLAAESDAEYQRAYGMNSLQVGERLMKSIADFVKRTGAPVDLYRVSWAHFSPEAVNTLTADFSASLGRPLPAMFTASKNGEKPSKVKGPIRLDAETWFVHKMTEDFTPFTKKPNGDYLESGWLITDTKRPFIRMVNERKESQVINGKNETVQVISYQSAPFEGDSLSFERIFLLNGKLIGSIESYGKYGKAGYFDYDNTGKMQYRVRYQLRAGM